MVISSVAIDVANATQTINAAASGKRCYLLGLFIAGTSSVITIGGVAFAAATQWQMMGAMSPLLHGAINTDFTIVTTGTWKGVAIIGVGP